MSRDEHSQAMFTAADVARFCQVDLKTIHNWAERGEIEHFRTPGRHLRFRSVDTLDFLRRYGYPIPRVLIEGRPRVAVLDGDVSFVTQVKRVLAKRCDVAGHGDPIDGLLAIGRDAPDAVLLDVDTRTIDGLHCLSRLRRHEQTKHVRTIACSRDLSRKPFALAAGATAFLDRSELSSLRGLLDALMGRARS